MPEAIATVENPETIVQRAAYELNGFGWDWHPDGVTVALRVNGQVHKIFVPVKHLWIEFGRAFELQGAPLQGVGDFSVGGWWSSLKKSVKKVARKATNTIKKGVQAVTKVAKVINDKVVRPALNTAKVIVNNPIIRHGIKIAAIAIPALAPVAVGIEAAAQALKLVDDGRKAAMKVVNAAHTVTASDRAAMQKANAVKANMTNVVALAKRGDPAAQRMVGAFKFLADKAA